MNITDEILNIKMSCTDFDQYIFNHDTTIPETINGKSVDVIKLSNKKELTYLEQIFLFQYFSHHENLTILEKVASSLSFSYIEKLIWINPLYSIVLAHRYFNKLNNNTQQLIICSFKYVRIFVLKQYYQYYLHYPHQENFLSYMFLHRLSDLYMLMKQMIFSKQLINVIFEFMYINIFILNSNSNNCLFFKIYFTHFLHYPSFREKRLFIKFIRNEQILYYIITNQFDFPKKYQKKLLKYSLKYIYNHFPCDQFINSLKEKINNDQLNSLIILLNLKDN